MTIMLTCHHAHPRAYRRTSLLGFCIFPALVMILTSRALALIGDAMLNGCSSGSNALSLHIVSNLLAAARPAVPLPTMATCLAAVTGEPNARVVVVAVPPWVPLCHGILIAGEDTEVPVKVVVGVLPVLLHVIVHLERRGRCVSPVVHHLVVRGAPRADALDDLIVAFPEEPAERTGANIPVAIAPLGQAQDPTRTAWSWDELGCCSKLPLQCQIPRHLPWKYTAQGFHKNAPQWPLQKSLPRTPTAQQQPAFRPCLTCGMLVCGHDSLG